MPDQQPGPSGDERRPKIPGVTFSPWIPRSTSAPMFKVLSMTPVPDRPRDYDCEVLLSAISTEPEQMLHTRLYGFRWCDIPPSGMETST
jgi:hypothetical protein